MRSARHLVGWRGSTEKPNFCQPVLRVVERRFAFGPDEKEKFRAFMRNFKGTRRSAESADDNTAPDIEGTLNCL